MGAGPLAPWCGLYLAARLGAEVPLAVARRFNQMPALWPAFAVLVVTGTWNIAAEQDRTNLIAKLAMVLVPGVTAFLHAPS
jgi:cellobiose-specific phosphotransferase system component IIC